jgi:hypothetical protein
MIQVCFLNAKFLKEPTAKLQELRVQHTRLATDVDLRSDARMRRADSARAAQLEAKADLEVS